MPADQWHFEKLKSIEQIFMIDSRSLFQQRDPDTALFNHHKMIDSIKLNDHVDDDVKVQFEIARNLFLYSFFYYRFGMTSFKQAAAATELGLRRYIGSSTDDRKNTLKKLLQRADSQGFINLKSIKPHLEPAEFIRILTDFRNSLAHGSHSLFAPHDCLSFIKDYARILNDFYSYVKESGLTPSLGRWE